MRTILAALFVLLALAVIPAAAQPDNADCTPAAYSDMLSDAAVALAGTDADLEFELTLLVTVIQVKRAMCAGLAFTGNTNAVVGPFTLPAGDYIVQSTAEYISTITFEALTDGCERFVQYEVLATLDSDGGTDSLILRTDADCTLLAEVSSRRPWTLVFTPIN